MVQVSPRVRESTTGPRITSSAQRTCSGSIAGRWSCRESKHPDQMHLWQQLRSRHHDPVRGAPFLGALPHYTRCKVPQCQPDSTVMSPFPHQHHILILVVPACYATPCRHTHRLAATNFARQDLQGFSCCITCNAHRRLCWVLVDRICHQECLKCHAPVYARQAEIWHVTHRMRHAGCGSIATAWVWTSSRCRSSFCASCAGWRVRIPSGGVLGRQ